MMAHPLQLSRSQTTAQHRPVLHCLTSAPGTSKAVTSSPTPTPLPGFPKQELQVATILIMVTRVATVMTTASVDVQPSCDVASTGCSAGATRAFEGTGIAEQSSVTAITPTRRNSGHRCAARGRTGPPLEDRSGGPVAGTETTHMPQSCHNRHHAKHKQAVMDDVKCW